MEALPEALGAPLRGYEQAVASEAAVGEGSLGLQNYLLLARRGRKDALVLQVKEATPSQLAFGLDPIPATTRASGSS